MRISGLSNLDKIKVLQTTEGTISDDHEIAEELAKTYRDRSHTEYNDPNHTLIDRTRNLEGAVKEKTIIEKIEQEADIVENQDERNIGKQEIAADTRKNENKASTDENEKESDMGENKNEEDTGQDEAEACYLQKKEICLKEENAENREVIKTKNGRQVARFPFFVASMYEYM
ncbi:hypothetical protein JTB14_024055 [Gonioctena quinquepunctata]|nr:hypothetical protein JTB14_024055 [Gonioctena quinquepunctata]